MATLVMIHCPTDTGFAVATLESAFFHAAALAEGSTQAVHMSYAGVRSTPSFLPEGPARVLDYEFPRSTSRARRALRRYVRDFGITRALAFDLAPEDPTVQALRRGGVRWLVSYQGAPMSGLNAGVKLALKRLEMRLRRHAPNHYIFESNGMLETAVHGRGIAPNQTSVVRLGVDTERFQRASPKRPSALRLLGVPSDRIVVLFTGHLLPRKGIAVLLEAARLLVDLRGDTRFHFLLCGDRPGEAERWGRQIDGTRAREFVTFGGYRRDIPDLMASADIGVIPSTGWDSFTMSAVEMAACELPLVVSNLEGLREAVVEDETGVVVPAGDATALATALIRLGDDPSLRRRLGASGRSRVLAQFSRDRQIQQIAAVLAGRPGS